ncbi:hypothetical protein [Desulfopila aestuarii]|uniref:Pilus assembly protein FimV n=1 Tax=Desulfopila aestuarii DSM 18488 TaxID=1121416 RepID=A0A1M7YED8_9BACT|nr:hypothetical protein [Desulfopila aestuarii]SHO51005.1 pilus assembly protein FimV [Desulfopila aestuarii DSM 18488]
MDKYTDSQYDDDLTIGADEYDDSFQTSDVDLFEFGGDEETTISRLKTLVLSIDWEITDEVLLQFNEEILDLKDVWADEKIHMVYLQALEKIGKYIYRDKADSHPNAIRLLLSMYYNLERIVLSGELSEADKKKILLEDVRRFEKLKRLISQAPKAPAVQPVVSKPVVQEPEAGTEIQSLKAIVLGIDWEITDNDLLALREEVARLEEVYADSKPKLVFLQGIGTVGTYIRKKKSNAHADAFKLLHSFYEGLEKLVTAPHLSLEEETEILKPEVKKFNAFKQVIAETLTKEAPAGLGELDEDEDDYTGVGTVAPAFADIPEEGIQGFQEELEAAALKQESPINVDEHIDKFFGDEEKAVEPVVETPAVSDAALDSLEQEVEEISEAFFGNGSLEAPESFDIDPEIALKGVDVETEADDDSDEEALPVIQGEVAPALVDSSAVSEFAAEMVEEEVASIDEVVAVEAPAPADEVADEISGRLDDFFASEEVAETTEEPVVPSFEVPAEVALQGVDVETPEDEEDEETPPTVFDELTAEAEPVASAFAEIDEVVEEPAAPEFEEISAALSDVEGEVEGHDKAAEEEVEQRFDELFASLPDDEIPAPIEDESLVEEEVEAFFSLEEEPEETPAAELAPEEDLFDQEILGVREEEPVAFEIEEDVDLEEEVAFEPVSPELAVPVEEFAPEEEVAEAIDDLVDLRGCVQSIGVELRDDIVKGLFSEIEVLQERWTDRPLEKGFLQLMATVTQHIDQYRFAASDASGSLLLAIMDDLDKATGPEAASAQELLLASTGRILTWQQEMLAKQAVCGEDGYLTFADATHVEIEEAEELTAEAAPVETALAEEVAPVEPEAEVAETAVELAPEDTEDRQITDIVRREIEALRETLKKEIAELRKVVNSD